MAKYYSHQNKHNHKLGAVSAVSSTVDEDGNKPAAYMLYEREDAKEVTNFAGRSLNQNQTKNLGYLANELGVGPDYLMHVDREDAKVNSYPNSFGPIRRAYQSMTQIDYLRPSTASRSKTNVSFDSKKASREEGIKYAKSYKEAKGLVDANRPTELFTHIPERTTIKEAFAHPDMRATMPIMGAYLHQKFGDLTASHDLSKYSSKMVKHAQDMGLPVKSSPSNIDANATNPLTFKNWTEAGVVESINDSMANIRSLIPDEEVSSAKKHYRELRGIGKKETPAPLSTQFQQPKLPGMEDF